MYSITHVIDTYKHHKKSRQKSKLPASISILSSIQVTRVIQLQIQAREEHHIMLESKHRSQAVF